MARPRDKAETRKKEILDRFNAVLAEEGLEDASTAKVASYAGLHGAPTYGTYVASKAAVVAITGTAALELALRGIRVNCACPSTVDTPMAYAEGAEVELGLANMFMPPGRLARPEETAAICHFLASDDCAMLTGLTIPIDGGMAAGPSLGEIGPLCERVFNKTLDMGDFKAEG